MSIVGDPERLLSFSNGVYIVAAVLTVLATFAIVHFGNKVTSLKQQQLRAYQGDADARIAVANAQSADANIKVAVANATAAEANAKAVQAQSEVAKANALAAQATATARTANQRAEEASATAEASRLDKAKIEHTNLLLQEQLNKEHEARLELERKTSQRGLTMKEAGDVERATYPLGVQPIDIVYYKDDPEVRMLAGNLGFVFRAWKITNYEAPGGTSHQVDVEYDPSDKQAEIRATAIFSALNATQKLRVGGPFASLPYPVQGTETTPYATPPSATIRITVGYRY